MVYTVFIYWSIRSYTCLPSVSLILETGVSCYEIWPKNSSFIMYWHRLFRNSYLLVKKMQLSCWIRVCFAHGKANGVIFLVPRKYTLSSLPSLTFCCLSMLYFVADCISYTRVLLNICNGRSGVRFPVKTRGFFFSTPCRPALRFSQPPPRQCAPGYFHGLWCIHG